MRFPRCPQISRWWWALGALAACGARADDWPQFRGLHRDGAWNETGLRETFPAEGLKIVWRAPVGWGWSSPVVARGRVWVTDAELIPPRARERIHCFDAATGAARWTFAYEVTYPEWAFVPGQGGGPTATPIVEADRLFAVGANGQVHCLDAGTGALIWEKELGKIYEVREMQCRPSPLIEGELLILCTGAQPGATVLALDKKTGKEIWKALDEPVSNSSPLIVEAGTQRQLIVWTDASVTALNPATGATWWREPMMTSNNDSIPTPVSAGNRLLISGLMLTLDPARPAAKVLWPGILPAARRLLSNTCTPLLRGEFIYAAKSGGELVCLDAGTGAVRWKVQTVTGLRSGASIHLTPTRAGTLLFTDEGNLIRAQLTPEGYREVSRAHLIDPTSPFAGRDCAWAPPAFADRRVFARSDRELVCASLAADSFEAK